MLHKVGYLILKEINEYLKLNICHKDRKDYSRCLQTLKITQKGKETCLNPVSLLSCVRKNSMII